MNSSLPKLFSVYRAAGYEPITGYSPFHFFNWREAPFTRFIKGEQIHGIFGIALQEVMFVEHFHGFISPRSILIIGNAHGWSINALALIFPEARIVAMDPDPAGVEFTNQLIAANGFTAKAVVAHSPDDVTRVVNEHLDGSVDFSLIDAVHDNQAIKVDFGAVQSVATDDAHYLFHDVINWNMIDGFKELLASGQLQGKVFTRTTSGMALAYSNLSPEFSAYLDCFTDPPGRFPRCAPSPFRISTLSQPTRDTTHWRCALDENRARAMERSSTNPAARSGERAACNAGFNAEGCMTTSSQRPHCVGRRSPSNQRKVSARPDVRHSPLCRGGRDACREPCQEWAPAVLAFEVSFPPHCRLRGLPASFLDRCNIC